MKINYKKNQQKKKKIKKNKRKSKQNFENKNIYSHYIPLPKSP